jgi:hypothetical protein
MISIVTIDLSSNFIDFIEEVNNLGEFSKCVIDEIDTEDLEEHIGEYSRFYDDRALLENPELKNFEMTSLTNGTGEVYFEVICFFGCSDLDRHDIDYISVDISIDKENSRLTITGQEMFEREPDGL